ncbi:MAG: WbqC family protein, partial [Prolixibacteraceae bacterium]
SGILLSTAYFAPIQYFSKLVTYPEIYIEQNENFIKQTYRNRTIILGANGPIALIVPVEKGRGPKIKIKDLRIAYDEEWQRNHWRTIFSAYNSSPFFEYYADDLEPFFRKRHEFLFDYNQKITETILEILEIPASLNFTEEFGKVPENCLNFREQISPKAHKTNADPNYSLPEYTQVFGEKFGFVPDLSILDLIFNEGPSAQQILEDSFVRS